MFILLIPSICISADTGIIEIYSDPSNAKIYIDGQYVGNTPYSNPLISVGNHQIKVILSQEYPAQYWSVNIDRITPQVKTFKFIGKQGGKFTGIEEEQKTEKFKGDIQFASIPTGALVFINNERMKKTPIGYKDVDVGKYTVRFELGSKKLNGSFSIIQNETLKLIADFNNSKILNTWDLEQAQKKEAFNRKEIEELRLKIKKNNNAYICIRPAKDMRLNKVNGRVDKNSTMLSNTIFDKMGNKHNLEIIVECLGNYEYEKPKNIFATIPRVVDLTCTYIFQLDGQIKKSIQRSVEYDARDNDWVSKLSNDWSSSTVNSGFDLYPIKISYENLSDWSNEDDWSKNTDGLLGLNIKIEPLDSSMP